jgi:hypothetical protein
MLYSIVEMDRKHLGILYPVLIIGMGVALAFVSAAFDAGLRLDSSLGAAASYQAATPTPTAQAVSHAGSTDGIVWLGFVIVAIVLLPILLRRGIWTK